MDVRTPATPLLTVWEVRRRLATLDAELTRLERDRDVVARAFHTHVARIAYAALLEAEARLGDLPTLDVTPEATVTFAPVLQVEAQPWIATTAARRREILDL